MSFSFGPSSVYFGEHINHVIQVYYSRHLKITGTTKTLRFVISSSIGGHSMIVFRLSSSSGYYRLALNLFHFQRTDLGANGNALCWEAWNVVESLQEASGWKIILCSGGYSWWALHEISTQSYAFVLYNVVTWLESLIVWKRTGKIGTIGDENVIEVSKHQIYF